MSRHIDADRLKKNFEWWEGEAKAKEFKEIFDEIIDAQPTADVVERKRGKWIEYVNSHCECPFCHKEWSFFENMTEWFNFCPNCGAEMEANDAKVH